jgi:drug/metabolite transporter (DMT)-like permease
VACLLYFWAIQNLGLAKASLLSYTYVVFGALFAVPMLGEPVQPRHWAAIGTAFAGIVLLTGVTDLSVTLGDLAGLASGLLSGLAVVCVTRCRATDSSANIFWSQSWFGLLIVAWPTSLRWQAPTPGQWAMLVAIGLFAAGGQLLMTYAYKFTGATNGSLYALLTPVLSTLLGVVCFGERLGVSAVAGAALILGACAWLSFNPVADGKHTAGPGAPAPGPCCGGG